MAINATLLTETCNIEIQTLKDTVFEIARIQFPHNLIIFFPLFVFLLFGIFSDNLSEKNYWIAFFLILISLPITYGIYVILMVL